MRVTNPGKALGLRHPSEGQKGRRRRRDPAGPVGRQLPLAVARRDARNRRHLQCAGSGPVHSGRGSGSLELTKIAARSDRAGARRGTRRSRARRSASPCRRAAPRLPARTSHSTARRSARIATESPSLPCRSGKVEIHVRKDGFLPGATAITADQPREYAVILELERLPSVEEEITVHATRTDARLQDRRPASKCSDPKRSKRRP